MSSSTLKGVPNHTRNAAENTFTTTLPSWMPAVWLNAIATTTRTSRRPAARGVSGRCKSASSGIKRCDAVEERRHAVHRARAPSLEKTRVFSQDTQTPFGLPHSHGMWCCVLRFSVGVGSSSKVSNLSLTHGLHTDGTEPRGPTAQQTRRIWIVARPRAGPRKTGDSVARVTHWRHTVCSLCMRVRLSVLDAGARAQHTEQARGFAASHHAAVSLRRPRAFPRAQCAHGTSEFTESPRPLSDSVGALNCLAMLPITSPSCTPSAMPRTRGIE